MWRRSYCPHSRFLPCVLIIMLQISRRNSKRWTCHILTGASARVLTSFSGAIWHSREYSTKSVTHGLVRHQTCGYFSSRRALFLPLGWYWFLPCWGVGIKQRRRKTYFHVVAAPHTTWAVIVLITQTAIKLHANGYELYCMCCCLLQYFSNIAVRCQQRWLTANTCVRGEGGVRDNCC